jgi:hypothetical protein
VLLSRSNPGALRDRKFAFGRQPRSLCPCLRSGRFNILARPP